MDQMKTGGLIRLLRQRQNMTQLEQAEKIGVSDKAVSKWERGCGAPDVSLLRPLAEALGVDVRALLRGELSDGELYVTSGHEMRRDHYISFIALLDDNQLSIRKQYPEGSLEARLPRAARGTLLWYCTRDGLFCQEIGKK